MRRVGLGFPPHRRVIGEARLPLAQRVSEQITANTKRGMMTRDALRISSGPRTCYGTLSPVQAFALTPDPGQTLPNTPANMRPGLRITNSRASANTSRGQSAGI